MQYLSTRGEAPELDFRGVTLTGLASDGGLYLPKTLPVISPDELSSLRNATYVETAERVIAPFVSESLDRGTLRRLLEETYGSFGHSAVTPLVQLDERHWLLELFHGPTLAFKDVALQLLGALFGEFHQSEQPLTIIGATSGDTGSAAIEAVAGRPGIRIFMLHPEGRVTDVQRRQMTTVHADNVHNIAISGSFDDAQAMVKKLFNDKGFRARHNLSAVNSINWARLVAQTVYYVHTAARLGGPLSFSVPSGNFGDVFAGFISKRMGLPIDRLLVATNVNDILARALNDGEYSVSKVIPTATPSMDIQISSNFERLMFELMERDGQWLAETMQRFEETGKVVLPDAFRTRAAEIFLAQRIDKAEMVATMRTTYEETGEILDPHTAIGLAAARRHADEMKGHLVTIATAHPAKFPDIVEEATGVRPGLPRRISHLFDREERFERLSADIDVLKAFIDANH